jgi:nicotinate-nucleotide adenylyltransferase
VAVSLRLGVFGGTFDPPHVGHLITAVNVRYALGLDLVLLVVAGVPWQKVGTRAITGGADRMALVTAAVAGVDGLKACDVELHRPGPSYTADTLRDLTTMYPGAEMFVILGADAAAGLDTWERHDEVRRNSTIVVVDRPGVPTSVAAAAPAAHGPDYRRWIHVEVPQLDVSSTDLRERVHDGRPLDYLVPASVRVEIERRGLYVERNDDQSSDEHGSDEHGSAEHGSDEHGSTDQCA